MKNGSKNALALVAGIAAGIALGYYIASEDKEKMVGDLVSTGKKIKSEWEKIRVMGKEFVEDLKNSLEEINDFK